MAVPSLEPVNI